MVHALSEIHRVLVPNGILIDLRPISDRWSIEVVSERSTRETARFQDLPVGLEDDSAANRAMTQAASNGWFRRDEETFFSYTYSWDTPSEMEQWIDEEWSESIGLDEEARRLTRSAWAVSDADSRVRVNVKLLIARWRVMKGGTETSR
jgi:hypothetical protein